MAAVRNLPHPDGRERRSNFLSCTIFGTQPCDAAADRTGTYSTSDPVATITLLDKPFRTRLYSQNTRIWRDGCLSMQEDGYAVAFIASVLKKGQRFGLTGDPTESEVTNGLHSDIRSSTGYVGSYTTV